MTKEKIIINAKNWSWKKFQEYNFFSKQKSVAVSVLVAFFIVVATGQILGSVNNAYNNYTFKKENQNLHVIVYSNRC